MPTDTRFLVVGASGFVGRHLRARLQSLAIPVVGTRSRSGRRPFAAPDLVPFDLDGDRIAHTLDAVDRGFFAGPARVEAVVCAAVDNMDWCHTEREVSRRIYVDRIRRLIDDLAGLGARITFPSTCFVFDGAVGNYAEDDPVAPVNEYARQKLEVERHLAGAAPDGCVVRLDKIVGDDPAEPTLFTQWLGHLRGGTPIVCIADSVLSPTFVGDVVDAILLGARLGLGGVHHVANPEQFLRADLARAFCSELGVPAHPVAERALSEFHFADARALKSSLNGSRFARRTGLQATPMREVLRRFHDRLRSS
ncbi:MAG: NAD(P)-dependent oxidoreductase [Limisphaerales bacterium]